MPVVSIVWHGAKPSLKRGLPVKGFNGLFKGFSTLGKGKACNRQ